MLLFFTGLPVFAMAYSNAHVAINAVAITLKFFMAYYFEINVY